MTEPLRVIAFGAHPDDCEYRAGGTAALWARMGHAVKFVSATNGDAGHHQIRGPELAARRLEETREVARRMGVEYEVLHHHDGQLQPTLELREDVIRLIREWRADLVLGPRPYDYHPDHRYLGLAVQDAAFLVIVPALVRDAPALPRNPVFCYFEDHFQRPNPFRPDISVIVDDALDSKIAALDAHVSQFYEWLPHIEGQSANVPADPAARVAWLKQTRAVPIAPDLRAAIARWNGAGRAASARYAESFELCEFGAQPDEARIRQLFPMLA